MATKRSLFKKPAWAAQTKSPVDDGKSIFQQNIYEDILHENQKKEERRLAKQRQKDEQNKSSRSSKAEKAEQPNKKRRISVEAHNIDSDQDVNDDERKFADGYESSDSDTASSLIRNKTCSKRDDKRSSSLRQYTPEVLDSPPRRGKADGAHKNDAPKEKSKIPQPDSDDELIVIAEVSEKPSLKANKTKSKKPFLPESESDSEPDEYVRDLKRAARAEARSKQIRAVQDLEAQESGARSPSSAPTGSSHSLNSQRNSNTPTPAAAGSTDSEVLIRIKTIIPGCSEIFVKRKASQTLEGLEKYFVETHKLSETLRQKVFFTWNLQKLYKSTTMSSILAQIRAKHGTNIDGSDRSEGRIELEAMTIEILNLRQQQLERARKIASGEEVEEDQAQGDQGTNKAALSIEAAERVQSKKGIVIHLKSNNEEDLPSMALRVHPDTAISRIIRGYKSKMGIDSSRKVYLMFDGERLEGEQIVEEIEFEDEDCVDVAAD